MSWFTGTMLILFGYLLLRWLGKTATAVADELERNPGVVLTITIRHDDSVTVEEGAWT